MKITIAEAGSANNIGSMALIENAIQIAKHINKDCEIHILSADPNLVKEKLQQSGLQDKTITVSYDFFKFPLGGSTIYKLVWLLQSLIDILFIRFLLLFTTKPYKLIKGRKMTILKHISKSNYVFCIGAERINDVYFKTAYLSLEALRVYQKTGAKLIHFSLTIGPVFHKSTINKAQKVLENSYAIFVRDTKSFELLNKMNVKSPYIYNSFDIAILQKPLNNDIELFKRLDMPKEPYICVSTILWAFRNAKGPMRLKEYNKAIAYTLDYIIEKYHLKVVFTPTVVKNGHNDDIMASKNIVKLMKYSKETIIINELLIPSELATVFSKCQFSIVTRMHAAILCTGAGGRPIIAINYLYKLREYMKNIGFENYSVDIDYVNEKDLIMFTDRMIKNYDTNLKMLHRNLNNMRQTLLNNINNIAIK